MLPSAKKEARAPPPPPSPPTATSPAGERGSAPSTEPRGTALSTPRKSSPIADAKKAATPAVADTDAKRDAQRQPQEQHEHHLPQRDDRLRTPTATAAHAAPQRPQMQEEEDAESDGSPRHSALPSSDVVPTQDNHLVRSPGSVDGIAHHTPVREPSNASRGEAHPTQTQRQASSSAAPQPGVALGGQHGGTPTSSPPVAARSSPYRYSNTPPSDAAAVLAPYVRVHEEEQQRQQPQQPLASAKPTRSAQRTPTTKVGYASGMNVSTGANYPDTLVAYTGGGGGTRGGGRSPSEAGSHSPGGRQAELRGLLITAEREVAELREECARRGIAIDTLEAALGRERAGAEALRDRRIEDLEDARSEHEAQTKQLRDQIRVLKMVSESAMADKAKTAEDAARRKRELLALLEREREEKSYIMADYREQTESLIAEQGKEITALRAALDKVKEDYDRLAAEHEQALNTRDGLGDQVEDLRGQLDKERLEAARRLKDAQERLANERAALQEELSARQEEHARAATAAEAKRQATSDQLLRAQEKLAKLEEEGKHSMEGLRQTYRRDLDGLEKELAATKALRERQEEEHRRELEKAARSEEKTADALRQALEEARKATEAAVADGYRQREEMQTQQRGRLAQVQAAADAAGKELAAERAARKDAQSEAEVLRVRVDNLDKTVQELSHELESVQVEARTRERASDAAHQAELEEVKAKLRGAAGELSYCQQQQRQQALEGQKLKEELATKQAALEQARGALHDTEAKLEAEMDKQADTHAAREAELATQCEALKAQNTALESARVRLDRALKDAEARLQSVSRQADEERAALEDASRQLGDARNGLEDLRQALALEKIRSAGLEEQKWELAKELQESQLRGGELENAARMQERRAQEAAQDAQRLIKANEAKLGELTQRHKAEMAAARLATDQSRGELARAKDALQSKEAALQELREEINQLHREAALREGGLSEELEDAKEAHEDEMRRMDEILNGLRSDLAKAQQFCTQYQRELAAMHRSADGRYGDLESALEQSEAARARLQEDAKYREQLNQELQGTVRLLTSRLGAHEEEVRRTQEELSETSKKVQDAHTLIGRKDATIGQLNAKLRAYEARGGVL